MTNIKNVPSENKDINNIKLSPFPFFFNLLQLFESFYLILIIFTTIFLPLIISLDSFFTLFFHAM